MQGPNTYFLGAVIGEEKRYDSSPCPASWTSAKRLESKPPFGGGRREQGRKLGSSLSCPPPNPLKRPPRSSPPGSSPHPSCFLLPSPPIDAHSRRRRRKKPTRQRHQGEIYYKNCTKEPVCWPGLGLLPPGQGVRGCGVGLQVGTGHRQGEALQSLHSLVGTIQSKELGTTPVRDRGGKGSGRVLVKEEAAPAPHPVG